MDILLAIGVILVVFAVYSVSVGGAAITHDDLTKFTDSFIKKEILRVGAWFKRHNDGPQDYRERVAKSGVTSKYHDYYERLADEESRRSLARKILNSIPEFNVFRNLAYETFINDGMMKIAWSLRKDEKWADEEIIDWVKGELKPERDLAATEGTHQLAQDKPSNQCDEKAEKKSIIHASKHYDGNEVGNGTIRINYGNDDHIVTWEDLGEKSAKVAISATRIYYDIFKENAPNVAEVISHNFGLFLLDTLPLLITADIVSLVGGKNLAITEGMLKSYCNGAAKIVVNMTDPNNSPIFRAGCAEYIEGKIKLNCNRILHMPGKPTENGILVLLIKEWVQLLWIELGLPSFESEEKLKNFVFIFFSVSSKIFDPSASAKVVQIR